MTDTEYDVGVIIARFQVADLHEAHRTLISDVKATHPQVIILLGVPPIFDRENPLSYAMRETMVRELYPDVVVAPLWDHPSNEEWSRDLDTQLAGLLGTNQTACLYGGRESFIPLYSGSYPTRELKQNHWVSGSYLREQLKNHTVDSAEARRAVIWASWQMFDTSYQTVDIAVLRPEEDHTCVLLARKEIDGDKWRFPGGFVQPSDTSLEAAAKRELREEVPGVVRGPLDETCYLGSFRIEDWRYQSSCAKICTAFFYVLHLEGNPRPADDVDEVQWFRIDDLRPEGLVPAHGILLTALQMQLPTITSNL